MAESICNSNGWQSGLLGIKYKSACSAEKMSGVKDPNIPIFAPEGIEGAQSYVNKNFPGCNASKDGLINSTLLDFYRVDCQNK